MNYYTIEKQRRKIRKKQGKSKELKKEQKIVSRIIIFHKSRSKNVLSTSITVCSRNYFHLVINYVVQFFFFL